MKIIVLGATGMLGHKLIQILSKNFEVLGTVRKATQFPFKKYLNCDFSLIENINVENINTVESLISDINPDVIVNCIGIVKQHPAALDPLQSITINSLFPHQLAKICHSNTSRLIHISTDCVFSGQKGNYSEMDNSDAEDLYGRTKFLGEVDYPGCLTIRTSMIGREIQSSHGLIEWFLSQENNMVYGYKNAIFSGLTTITLSEIISKIVSSHPNLSGIQQVASIPISKYDLLNLVKKKFETKHKIEPDISIINDRSLNPERFFKETNIEIPSWEYMIDQMYRDPTPYNMMRQDNAQQ